ncbi:MAG: exo-alpha-sialidase [Spirochaetaceae bacterium]|nr:exo-alpha-sialidase [Spirochaetaceae bacterium]
MTRSPKMTLAAIAAAVVASLAACSDFYDNAEAINPSSGNEDLSWTASALPSSSSQSYYCVTYGDGKFIAAGDGSTIAVSTDGINWTADDIIQNPIPYSNCWYSSSYGNGTFVMVDLNYNEAATSTDGGETWTRRTLPDIGAPGYSTLTYGNGRFVALGTNGTNAAYSTDGITWTASTLPSSRNWHSVAAGDGLFVAVSLGSDAAAYSSDGITWNASTLPSSQDWFSVTYGNGIFVAVSDNAYSASTNTSGAAAFSTDGINWTASSLPPLPGTQRWWSVTYGGGVFLAVTYTYETVATSTDGQNWTAWTLPDSAPWRSSTYGNGTFVAVSDNGKAVAGSQ